MRMNDAYRTLKTGSKAIVAENEFAKLQGAMDVYERSWFWSIGLLRPSRHVVYFARNVIYKWVAVVADLVEECARLKVENETLKQNAAEAKRVRQRYDQLRRGLSLLPEGSVIAPGATVTDICNYLDDTWSKAARDALATALRLRLGDYDPTKDNVK